MYEITSSGLYQEKMRGQRGRLPVQALGYVNSTKVIFGLPKTAGAECVSVYHPTYDDKAIVSTVVPYLSLFLHHELRKLTTLQLKHKLTARPRSVNKPQLTTQ